MQKVFRKTGIAALTRMVPLLLLCVPMFATLGEPVASVQTDQAHMKGSLRVTQNAAYSVHEIQAQPGAVVREYASPQGTVFGVAWQGPGYPDMRQLLGTYFDQYAQAMRTRTTRRGPVYLQLPGLVVQVSGHARAFTGKAYVPQMLPQGVTADTVK